MLAPYVHAWDPRWLYVVTVGLIAALDGWLIGIAAAVGAVVCYELMSFGAFGFVADRDALLLAAAIVAAIVARTLRVSIARPRLAAARTPQLLTGIINEARAGEDARSSDAIRDATAALRKALDEERSRAEHERVLRLEQERQSRALIESTTGELHESKRVADEMTRRNSELQSALDAAESAARSTAERIAELERACEQLRERIADLEVGRDAADACAVDLQWSQEQLQQKFEESEALQRAAHDRAADLDEGNAQLRAALAAAEAAQHASALRITQLEEANAHLRAEANQQRYRLDSEWSEKLARNAVDITDRFNAALMAADARTDAARAEAAELRNALDDRAAAVAATERQAGYLEAENAEIRTAAGELRARVEAQWQEKVGDREAEIARLTVSLAVTGQRAQSSAENAAELGARIAELEQLNAQLREASATGAETQAQTAALRLQIAEVEAGAARLAESHAADLRRTEAEWSEKFARSAMEVTQRFQSELAAAAEQLAVLRNENEATAARIRELEIENSDIRAAAEADKAKLEDGWNEKLQTIVHHLASDHEADIGQATLEKEEARAEARRLAKRLSQLETSGREIAGAFEEIQKRNEALRLEIEEQRSRADAERERAGSRDSEWSARLAANALELTQRFNGTMAAADTRLQDARREAQTFASRIHELEQINAALRVSDQERRTAIDAEWSEKLETIVNHLASDHETDVGQATLEREEARAEVRHYSSRLAALQKTAAAERAAFEESKAEWTRERDELTRSVDLLRRRLGLGTHGGSTPVPSLAAPLDRNPAVLFVHRDSAVRAIAKHALESCGYDVTTACDGLEAFRVAMSQKPDVILAESTMPKMDGRELVQMLKARSETAAVKIVLMAGAGNEAGSYASSDFRADDFLRDPANVEALKSTLANVLAARV